ncbi:MAG: diacylglycerol kinase [Sedimenticola sp.]|uniref:Diacylglycerol kinase n=1 Tax=Sedimenticola thiotaurini TaxID=1543721 RepID=A0A558DEW6_9GAMM|nr:diacylglycerol kinase [Sedimenticola sp.]MCW8975200.1 diacylglycerol kinase [Sedimenticola sp.]MCW9022271.1 diacylglycerol kinase [Sedimenticola sp.]TVT59569.1 MAG: diacylglycerol kinase [Sedimenticola thiotaurini]
MANQKATGLRRIINAWGYSIAGFKACFQHEAAFRQELFGLVVLLPLALYLGQSGVERALLAGSLLLVLLMELVNSAVEAVVDRFGGEQHALSGRAKDLGSAAVFLAIAAATLTWVLILFGR